MTKRLKVSRLIDYSKRNISALNASVAYLDSVSPFDSGCNRFKSSLSDCEFGLATAQLRNSLYGVSQPQGVQDIGNLDAQVIDIQLVETTNEYYENKSVDKTLRGKNY